MSGSEVEISKPRKYEVKGALGCLTRHALCSSTFSLGCPFCRNQPASLPSSATSCFAAAKLLAKLLLGFCKLPMKLLAARATRPG
ncbi:hypothetical protein DPEC_G00094580 [Dallia pectoralis]|uniref:Uncharacterized protein n=1 Tax=Dallia pectoralis TaxID=75939 RepID=A0ACC2H1A1_DALPE|nr:hypothetical protein DPEC_G00094580 [Dallia pectoralis]